MKRNSRSTKKKPAKDGRTTLAFARAEMPFVVSTPQSATAPPDNTQRTFVRSHVMQNYLHGKSFIVPKSSFRELPSLSKEAAPNAKKQMSCFRLEKPLVKKKVAAIRPRPIEEEEYDIETLVEVDNQRRVQDGLSSFRRDPFIQFPVKGDPDVHSLFIYYMKELDNNTLRVSPETDYVPVALGDPACFHMTLATVAQYRGLRSRNPNSSSIKEYWYHRGRAIEMLNKELTTLKAGVTDAMICTVGLLAYTDTHIAELKPMAGVHISALMKLIDLRGGLEKIELCGMILRLSLWYKISAPISPVSTAEHPDSTSTPSTESDPVLETSIINLTPFLCRDMSTTKNLPHGFDDLCHFGEVRNNMVENPHDKKSKAALNALTISLLKLSLDSGKSKEDSSTTGEQEPDHSSTHHRPKSPPQELEHSKQSKAQTPPYDSIFNFSPSTRRILLMSKILFSYSAFPSMSIAGAFSRSIADALHQQLEMSTSTATSPAEHETQEQQFIWPPELLCWVLISGASAYQDPENRTWFIARLAELALTWEISSFEELVTCLKCVFWVEGELGLEKVCQDIWRDVEDIIEEVGKGAGVDV